MTTHSTSKSESQPGTPAHESQTQEPPSFSDYWHGLLMKMDPKNDQFGDIPKVQKSIPDDVESLLKCDPTETYTACYPPPSPE